MLIERATTVGVDLSPRRIPNIIPFASSSSSGTNIDFEAQNFTGWTAKYNITGSFSCSVSTPNSAPNSRANFTTLNRTLDETGICTTGN